MALSPVCLAEKTTTESEDRPLTEVIVLPTIHGNHEKSKTYSLKRLEAVVREIAPGYVCSEITPASLEEYDEGNPDKRLSYFPEYTKVILPLRKELKYEVIPCSAFTQKVNFRTVGVAAMDKVHYEKIAKALDGLQGQGAKVLITFGSGHVDGLLKQLRTRKDLELTDYRPSLAR